MMEKSLQDQKIASHLCQHDHMDDHLPRHQLNDGKPLQDHHKIGSHLCQHRSIQLIIFNTHVARKLSLTTMMV
jgi:hypothetical protein